jgi:autotransporter strand-loop-strand O-heptosyltransferase
MAHREQREFCESVKKIFPDFFKNKKVLDIGSLDINGNNRYLFENCDYLGIDVGEGRNVDYIAIGHLYEGPNNYFDTIISTEVFEHDMYYEETIKNVIRMLKPDGLFLFTCAAPGRPEHGTRRQGEFCAPLLLNVSETWADYYKNLMPNDFRVINGFNETFPDSYFEIKDTNIEIPSDLYFYGVKGGIKKNKSNGLSIKNPFDDDIFIIDSWTDTIGKENDLISLIKILKEFNIPILLTGHYEMKPEIQKMVDYYLFDKNNDLLKEHEFEQYGVNSGRWTDMGTWKVENKNEFHHDYAIWCAMRNSFNFAKSLGKKHIHFFEYDNLPDPTQYRQAFLEYSRNHDAILYEYHEGSSKDKHFAEYCATFIFSIKTDIAIQVIDKVKSKQEYFTNRPKGWQLERVFLQHLREVTNSIFVSKYIANNNELNTQAVWNRDGMNRNGARFQIYLAGNTNGDLYLHFLSGFHEKEADSNYLVEFNYQKNNGFHTIKKGESSILKIGKYNKGARVKVHYQGVEVYNEYLKDEFDEFRRKNKIIFKDSKANPKVNLHFIDGPFVEILENQSNLYNVQFINKKSNKVLFETNISSNHWVKPAHKYYIDWSIKIKGIENDFYFEHDFNVEKKRVLIAFETKSLGDNISFIPYVEKFRKEHNCEVICSTFHNHLFKNQYKNIEFVEPGSSVENLYALFRLGLFYKDNKEGIDYYKHPTDPRTEPLLKIASDILGLDYEEIHPKLPKLGKKKKKMVTIGVHSTAQSKYWNNPTGWQDVVNFLLSKGYEVRLLSKEEDGYMGNNNPKGVTKQPNGTILDVLKTIQESEFFIGISSGLSWLAWGGGVPVVLISGFTDIYTEPFNNVIRIINKDVCNSCWNSETFDAGDWNWCPIQKGTERQFECSKNITSDDVISKINHLII